MNIDQQFHILIANIRVAQSLTQIVALVQESPFDEVLEDLINYARSDDATLAEFRERFDAGMAAGM